LQFGKSVFRIHVDLHRRTLIASIISGDEVLYQM
jgi:hypothetical protein